MNMLCPSLIQRENEITKPNANCAEFQNSEKKLMNEYEIAHQ